MTFQIKKAKRTQSKLKLCITAPSGCGKSYGALLLAKGLVGNWEDICVIDTENGSASLYENLGSYNVLELSAPYTPERYMEAIRAIHKSGAKVCIIDSASHAWAGPGGCLEIHQQLGGRFEQWSKVKPRHRAFVELMLQTPMHFIVTLRAKTEYSLEKNDRGKTEPIKVGLRAEQHDGIEYEFTTALRINQNHLASVDKDRSGILSGRPEFKITEETGKELRQWLESAESIPSTPTVIASVAATSSTTADPASIDKVLSAFAGLGVTQEQLEGLLRHPVHSMTTDELSDFRTHYQGIKAGKYSVKEMLSPLEA